MPAGAGDGPGRGARGAGRVRGGTGGEGGLGRGPGSVLPRSGRRMGCACTAVCPVQSGACVCACACALRAGGRARARARERACSPGGRGVGWCVSGEGAGGAPGPRPEWTQGRRTRSHIHGDAFTQVRFHPTYGARAPSGVDSGTADYSTHALTHAHTERGHTHARAHTRSAGPVRRIQPRPRPGCGRRCSTRLGPGAASTRRAAVGLRPRPAGDSCAVGVSLTPGLVHGPLGPAGGARGCCRDQGYRARPGPATPAAGEVGFRVLFISDPAPARALLTPLVGWSGGGTDLASLLR